MNIQQTGGSLRKYLLHGSRRPDSPRLTRKHLTLETLERRTVLSATGTFEDVGAALPAESYWKGSDGSGGFTTGPVEFNNYYSSGDGWESWDGWAYSNKTDTTTPGFLNQYSAYPGAGAAASETYGVAYVNAWGAPPAITLADAEATGFQSIQITSTTYAALAMLQGDSFSRKFGWLDANDDDDFDDPGDYAGDYPDWFLLTITGKDSGGASVGDVDFYLADYRFANDAEDYVVDAWTTVDLTPLAGAVSLEFSLDSSDVGVWGMNTPAYFAADDVVVSEGQIVSLDGSSADNEITFTTTATQHVVTIDGTPYAYDRASQINFTIDGLDGNDQITIVGTDGDETAELQPGTALVSGPGYSLQVVNIETIEVEAGTGGTDQVTLNGSAGSNRLYSYHDHVTLSDSPRSYSFRAEGFGAVTIDAAGAGSDYAFLYDGPQDDELDASPDQVALTRDAGTATESTTTATGFQRIYAYANQAGVDTATLTGADDATNRFYGYDSYGIFTDSSRSFYFYARDFDSITANSAGNGSTVAYLYDSSGNDTFSATTTSATMDRAGLSSSTANGFASVYAYSTRGGVDSATLAGSDTGGNQYRGYPTYSTLTDTARSFYHYARGFASVAAVGSQTETSSDRAYLYDSSGDDTLTSDFFESNEYRGGVLTDGAGTYENSFKYFDIVYARSTDSGTNDTIVVAGEESLAYQLIRMGTWQ